MAKTSLCPNGQKVTVITDQEPEGLVIRLYQADDDYNPIGTPEEFVEPNKTEEEFHKGLRKEADLKEHYVSKFSTNPEYNPGYIEPTV